MIFHEKFIVFGGFNWFFESGEPINDFDTLPWPRDIIYDVYKILKNFKFMNRNFCHGIFGFS